MKPILLGLVILSLLVPSAARAALVTEANCDDKLPHVLNVGLPQARMLADFQLEQVWSAADRLFGTFYRMHGPCSGQRRLQINIAVGNDYQILDWLGRGLVDVGVVPTLSLHLLARDGVDLLEFKIADPVRDLLLPTVKPRLRSRVFQGGAWRDRIDPEADFAALREALWCHVQGDCPKPKFRLALPSHLSTAGFLAPVDATAAWLEAKESAGLRDQFWKAFFDHTRFTLDDDAPERRECEEGLIEIAAEGGPGGPGGEVRDHLVIARRAAEPIFRTDAFQPAATTLPPSLARALEAPAFASLLAPEPYFGVRTYGFTVEESVRLLRQHQQTSGKARLALVLPGGGVKAAYQSKLIDELYGKRYLKNALAADGTGSGKPLDVDLVIGTSGGALVGYFVARLAEGGPWKLSQILWNREDGAALDSTDIFGLVDLPRYLSVMAIFLTLAGLLAVLSVPQRSLIPSGPLPDRSAWRPRLVLAVWPLLLLTPFLVRAVNGPAWKEHIPVIEGVFYALCASLAMFADQCLVLRPLPPEDRPREVPRRRVPSPLPPALFGLAGVILPFVFADALLATDVGSFLVCLGLLCLLVAGVLWAYRSPRYHLEKRGDFSAGFSLSLLHLGLVYAVLFAVLWLAPDWVSLLELTGEFWVWVLPTALAAGVLLVILGLVRREARGGRYLFRGFSYLCSHHPNGSLVSRRFLRIAMVSVFCFLWWNVVLAPALYGNKHAREFLQGAVAQFGEAYRKAHPGRDVHRLAAQLLVPANVLESDGTRYFLMVPEDAPECPSVIQKPGSGARWYQYRVRTSAVKPLRDCPHLLDRGPEEVEKVITASGSPFPIFPAHMVDLPDEEEKQALVDGGYSNNVPVDAALSMAAAQVLIVESENPLGHGDGETGSPGWMEKIPPVAGPLIADLARLPGFLFERSQQVDRLSKRELFVVSFSPSREEKNWPVLFDFRRSRVERLRRVAEDDLARRIGLVESWGPPRFQLSVLVAGSA